MKVFNFLKGKKGETIAEKYLRKKGYKILEKNFYTKIAETDIIALDKNILVFIEVKARNNLNYGQPSEAIDSRKIKKLRNNAEIFLINFDKEYNGVRFDVIEVIFSTNEIRHIEAAF